jgi:organic hydroperoxide reductase OsmC/OhrA
MRLNKHLHYATKAEWDHQTGGTADLHNFIQEFDTPKEYGGNESAPCPDQLFMTSIAGCIINTYNYYREMLEVETLDLKVKASSDLELTEVDGYRIKSIKIEIHIWSTQDQLELNKKCAQRARDYCHITKSIEKAIPIEITIKTHIK